MRALHSVIREVLNNSPKHPTVFIPANDEESWDYISSMNHGLYLYSDLKNKKLDEGIDLVILSGDFDKSIMSIFDRTTTVIIEERGNHRGHADVHRNDFEYYTYIDSNTIVYSRLESMISALETNCSPQNLEYEWSL